MDGHFSQLAGPQQPVPILLAVEHLGPDTVRTAALNQGTDEHDLPGPTAEVDDRDTSPGLGTRFGQGIDLIEVERHGVVVGRQIGKDVTELALALAYYPTTKLVVKAEYTLFGEGRGTDKDNDQLGLQVAVKF